MTASNSHITILTLNVNGLNAPIKRHKLANWINSQDSLLCCILGTHLMYKDKHRLKIKGWRKIYQICGKQKEAEFAVLVSDKTDFKPTKIKRDKDIYAPNTGALRSIKQVLKDLQRDLVSQTIIVGDFNTPLSILDQQDRKLTRVFRT